MGAGPRWTELAGSRAVDEAGREASGARMDELLDEERLDKKSTQVEESERRKRTSEVSTTFTANTTVKCSRNSSHAAGLASGQEFLFLTKIVTTG